MESLTVSQLVIAAGGALVAVIGILWHKHDESNKYHVLRGNKLEEELNDTRKQVLELTERVGYADGVEDVASALIEEIKNLRNA